MQDQGGDAFHPMFSLIGQYLEENDGTGLVVISGQ